jgi:hypothetical protein
MQVRPESRHATLPPLLGGCLAVALAAAIGTTAVAEIKVKVQSDRTFNFSSARTWQWSDDGMGRVVMARTADDDPEMVRQRAEPVLVEAVPAELSARGLTRASDAASDLKVTYYLLVTIGSNAQVMGQFLPSVPQWGLPPIPAATQALRTIEQGSLVLDFSAGGRVVWRGVANAEIQPGQAPEKRVARLREAVHEIVKRFPRTKK